MTVGRRGKAWLVGLLAVAAGGVPGAVEAQTESALTWRIPELAPPEPVRAEEFAARRKALTDSLGDGVYLVLGAPAPAQDYLPYQQNPEFRYLVGIEEPDAALVMVRSGGRLEERVFVQPRNPSREVWEGVRLGPEGARALTRIQAEPMARLNAVVDSLLRRSSAFLTSAPPADREARTLSHEQQVVARFASAHPRVTVKSVQQMVQTLRARKSPAELDRIRRATYISAEAHRQAMQAAEPGMNEFEVQALVEYFFRRNGGDGPAYASIVGSGPNATTLHYNANDRCMNDGDVLLFDVASYFAGYASDITRTVPVNGRFTPEQRGIYEVVLAAQKAAERQIRQGATWQQLNQVASAELANGLAKLGLIDAPDATYDCGSGGAVTTCPQLRLFYMHGLGHGVGLEVHDPDISYSASFQPGSAVTIEPGIYVRGDAFDYLPDTPGNRAMIQRLRPTMERYANVGVRIEDVFIFDYDGRVERASRGAPREPDEVEALMKEQAPAASGRRGDVVTWRCPRVSS